MSVNTTLDLLDSTGPMIESGINQLIHPNPHIRARLVEHSVSGCPNGCKYYQDPRTKTLVLAHSPSYGCTRTKLQIQRDRDEINFNGRNVWMVSIKDRYDQEFWDNLAMRSAINLLDDNKKIIVDAFTAIGATAVDMAENIKSSFNRLSNSVDFDVVGVTNSAE